jgi:hypothetical protein
LFRCANTSSPPETSFSLYLTRVDFSASENNSLSTASSSANSILIVLFDLVKRGRIYKLVRGCAKIDLNLYKYKIFHKQKIE